MVDPTLAGEDPRTAVPLDKSAREILKGTLVRLKAPAEQRDNHGLVKYGTVRQLAVSEGETDAVREHLAVRFAGRNGDIHPVSASTLDLFRSFEDPIVAALRPGISSVAKVPTEDLASFATALLEVRIQRARAARENHLPAATTGEMIQAVNAAVVASRGLTINTAAQPIGMLNLERIEMVPAGIERGELVATIPLAPGEQTAVTHKEWSVTSKEFTSIVTDSLEQTSETGVTDNNDLSQSTTSQTQHSNQFNITGTIQGGIPIINGSSTAGATVQDATSNTATDSIKHATSMTQKASARSRQEHKTTITTTTVTGASETSTRTVGNPSTTDPIRIDYFSLMRKWRVRLYRFGLRLTYDMVIPEPAAAMRRAYMELESLQNKLGPFVFDVKYSDITTDHVNRVTGQPPKHFGEPIIERYKWLADQHQASVPSFPVDPSPIVANARNDGAQEWVSFDIEFDVPPGASIKRIYLDCDIQWDKGGGDMQLHLIGTQTWPGSPFRDKGTKTIALAHEQLLDGSTGKPFLGGYTGHQKVTALINDGEKILIRLIVEVESTPSTIATWVNDVWNALYSASQTRYYSMQQDIAARIAAIQERLTDVDTLTLRREESDEIMKSVVKFVLGTNFDFMPDDVLQAFVAGGVDFTHGIGFDGSTLKGLNTDEWSVLRHHEDIVRFINQAIEWENVVTFLYSYFWDVPESWSFIRDLRHHDLTRQAFLRAGSARVVLTVRKGWEARWTRFVRDLTIDDDAAVEPTTGPYLTIAQEIAAYDDRNYPGIAPANPAKSAVRLQDAVYTTSSGKVDPSAGPVSIPVATSVGFVVGLRVVLDVEDDRHIQEAVVVTDIPTDGHHIVVDMLTHQHDGSQIPFPVLQPSDKGALIAEWNEYTPSSGTDIAVTSNLTTIA